MVEQTARNQQLVGAMVAELKNDIPSIPCLDTT